MKAKYFKIFLVFLLALSISFSFCPPQSHPLSEICPIDTNLNLKGYNITNVNYIFANDIVVSGSLRVSLLCLGNDCRSSWNVSGVGSAGFLAKWINESTLTFSIIFENNGKIGIGTTNPQHTLTVIGDINATGFVRASQLCIGNQCISSIEFGNVGGSGTPNTIPVWVSENSLGSTPFYLTVNQDLNFANKSLVNVSMINSTDMFLSGNAVVSGKIKIGSQEFNFENYTLEIVGSVKINASGTIFRLEEGEVIIGL